MTKRSNHYEAAFEQFLRDRQAPYVAVDETRRTLFVESSLKSLDFIVNGPNGLNWLIDVKGRQFPSGLKKRYWKNWSTQDDLTSLLRWENLFGERFRGLLVFAYNILGDKSPVRPELLYEFRDRRYGFVAVSLADYSVHSSRLSTKWNTVAMSARRFRECALPMASLL